MIEMRDNEASSSLPATSQVTTWNEIMDTWSNDCFFPIIIPIIIIRQVIDILTWPAYAFRAIWPFLRLLCPLLDYTTVSDLRISAQMDSDDASAVGMHGAMERAWQWPNGPLMACMKGWRLTFNQNQVTLNQLTFRISFGRSASTDFRLSCRIASSTDPETSTDTAYPRQPAHFINPFPNSWWLFNIAENCIKW